LAEFDINAALAQGRAGGPPIDFKPAPAGETAPVTGGLLDFANSAAAGIVEPFGFGPFPEAEAYRNEHPIAGLVSELAGTIVPYAGWYKAVDFAARKVPKIAKVLDFSKEAKSSPFMAGVKREVTKLAPFEAGRVGIAAGINDQDFWEEAQSSGINLALGGLIGGAFEKLASGTVGFPKKEIPGFDFSLPLTLQSRTLGELIEGGKVNPELLPHAEKLLNEINRKIWIEQPPFKYPEGGQKQFVQFLKGEDVNSKEASKLFASNPNKNVLRRGQENPTVGALEEPSDKIFGDFFGEKAERYVQYPTLHKVYPERIVDPKTNTFSYGGRSYDSKVQSITKGLGQPISPGLWIKQEVAGASGDEGLFVIVKEIPSKGLLKTGTAEQIDPVKFMVFKTDQPGRFFPQYAPLAKLHAASNDAWTVRPGPEILAKSPTLALATDWTVKVPAKAYESDSFPDFLRFVHPSKFVSGGTMDTMRRGAELMRRTLYPTTFQFTKNAKARWLWGAARNLSAAATGKAQDIVHGTKAAIGDDYQWWKIVGKEVATRGEKALSEIVQKMPDAARRQYVNFSRRLADEVPSSEIEERLKRAVIEGKLSDEAAQLIRRDYAATAATVAERKLLEKVGYIKPRAMLDAVGALSTRAEVGTGDRSIRQILNYGGQQIGVISGKTPKQVEELSKKIIDEVRERSTGRIELTKGQYLDVKSRATDLMALQHVTRNNNARRMFLDAAEKHAAVPDAEDIISSLDGTHGYLNKQLAMDVFEAKFGVMKGSLSMEDPNMAKILEERLKDLIGDQGKFAAWQNEVVDSVMKPLLGNNSATKISQTVAGSMFHLTLGMFHSAFPVSNMLSILTNILPQAAFVMNASEASLGRNYTLWPVADGAKRIVGSVGVWTPMKELFSAFTTIRKPTEKQIEDIAHGIVTGKIDPKFVEDNLGASALSMRKMRDAIAGKEPVLGLLKAASAYVPAVSEKSSRLVSYVVGMNIARSVLKLTDDEQVRRFAGEFVDNTMYQYAVMDRARLITGPLGSMFGLFKNWGMHQIGWMLRYGGEAAFRKNFAPLLWMAGTTGAVGGVAGLPLYVAADAFSKAISGKSGFQNIYDMLGDDEVSPISDVIYYGLPALAGISLQASIAAPFSDFARDAALMAGFPQWDRAQAIYRLGKEGIDYWQQTGSHPIKDKQTRDAFISAFAPRSIQNAYKGLEDGVLNSLKSGLPSVRGVTPTEQMLQTLGFQSIEIARAHEVAEELFADVGKMRAAISDYGKTAAQMMKMGDFDELTRLLQRAHVSGVPIDSVLRSANGIREAEQGSTLTRQFSPEKLAPFGKVLGTKWLD
jgi:hypothetical protein